MAKIIAWLVLIFIVLLALRLVNQRKARKQQRAAGRTAVEPMVRCTRCGVFLPRADAIQRAGEYACPDGQCVKR
jgi:ribosomal protein S26